MAYSLFIFVLVVVSAMRLHLVIKAEVGLKQCQLQLYVYFVAMSRLKIIGNLDGRFEEVLISYLFLVNLVPIIIIPFMWYETRKVAQLLNHWADFEV